MKISSFFSRQGGPWRGMELAAKLMVVNILVLVTSLPVITIGASVTAAYDVLMNDPEDTHQVTRRYFVAFRAHWKQASIAFIAFVATTAVLVFAVVSLRTSVAQYVPLLLLAVTLLTAQVYFPLLAVVQQDPKQNLIASLYIVLKRTIRPILALCLWGGLSLFPVFFPKLFFLWAVLGLGIGLYCSASIMARVFQGLDLLPNKDSAHDFVTSHH